MCAGLGGAQPCTAASCQGRLLAPDLEAQEIPQGPGPHRQSCAQQRGQWTGGCGPSRQAASGSSPCGPMPGVGVPRLADEALGRWELALVRSKHIVRIGQAASRPLGRPWPDPSQPPTCPAFGTAWPSHPIAHHPSCARALLSPGHPFALPQSGEEVPCAVSFGDRKQALERLSPAGGGGGGRKCASWLHLAPLPTHLQQAPVPYWDSCLPS